MARILFVFVVCCLGGGRGDEDRVREGLELLGSQEMVRLSHKQEEVIEEEGQKIEKSKLLQALAKFEEAISMDPNRAVNYAYKGNALFKLQRFAEAEQAYKMALQYDESQARFWSNLGSLYAYQADYVHALEAFSKAKGLDPTDGTLAKNYDSAEIFWRFEELVKALKKPELSETFDIESFLTGQKYSEKLEVSFKFVMQQRPDLHDLGLDLLRRAYKERPNFAIVAHLLADTLYLKHIASHGPAAGKKSVLLDEAKHILNASLQGAVYTEYDSYTCTTPPDEIKVHVVCVSSNDRPELQRLKVSADRLGWQLKILGLGKPWRGLGSKIEYLQEYLAQEDEVSPDDLILFVDAYDVLLLEPAKNMSQIFIEAIEPKRPGVVVFGAEMNCAPDPALQLVYPENPPSPFRYLNSGTILGRAHSLRHLLTAVHRDIHAHHVRFGADPFRFDDQRWYARFMLANPRHAILDITTRLFHTLHDTLPHHFHLSPFGLRSTLSNAFPALIHGNGNGIDTFHALSNSLQTHAHWPLPLDSQASSFQSTLSTLMQAPTPPQSRTEDPDDTSATTTEQRRVWINAAS